MSGLGKMIQKEQIENHLKNLRTKSSSFDFELVAVTKTHPQETLMNAYELGLRHFGENKVQEIVPKHEHLPKDINWHFIGHLQRNKVKYIAPFVHLIHSVDSSRLLAEVNKQAAKNDRIIDCLLQVHIAEEENKFGLDESEINDLVDNNLPEMKNVCIKGLMGMATNTKDEIKVRKEFQYLRKLFESLKDRIDTDNVDMKYLSMGMSQDYLLALEEGSNMIRVGSTIFGPRNYTK